MEENRRRVASGIVAGIMKILLTIERTAQGLRARTLARNRDGWKLLHTQTSASDDLGHALEGFVPERPFRPPVACLLFLPRSSFFWAWRPKEGREAEPADLFPVPAESLVSRSFAVSAGGRVVLGVSASAVDGYRAPLERRGIVLAGVAPRSFLQGEVLTGDAGLVIDATGATVEIGVRNTVGEILCCVASSPTTLIDDVRNVRRFVGEDGGAMLQRVLVLADSAADPGAWDEVRRELESDGFSVTLVDPALLNDLEAIARLHDDRRWITVARPQAMGVRRLWNVHRKNILAAASLALVAFSLALNAAIDATRLETKRLSVRQRLLRSDTASRQRTPRDEAPDPALGVLSAVLQRVPSASYLIEYRYDEPRRSLHLSGRAADYGKVSQFAAALTRDRALRDVRAGQASLVPVDHRTAVDFTVEATVP